MGPLRAEQPHVKTVADVLQGVHLLVLRLIVGYIPKRKRTHSHLSSHAAARYGAHCGDTLSFHGFGKNIHYLHYAGGQRQAKVLVRRPSFRRARDTGSIARQNR